MTELHDEATVRDHISTLSDHERRLTTLEASDRDQWSAINALRNRLPLWATIAFTLGGATIATLATLATR